MKRKDVLRLAAAMAAVFVTGMLVARMRGRPSASSYHVELDPHVPVPPALLGWQEREAIALPDGEARALAAGPDGMVVVAIDRQIVLLKGARHAAIGLPEEAMCLAVASNGLIVAGFRHSAAFYDADGACQGVVTNLGAKTQLSSIAVMGDRLYLADFGQRCVWKVGFDGTIDGMYPGPTPSGFVIPSAYFDVAASARGLWVVNPGMHELLLLDANLTELSRWRRDGLALEGFSGCCNPAHIASMACGGVVTSEKGVPRIKLYAGDGQLIDVVAPSEAFPGSYDAFDLAVGSEGRLLVLEAAKRRIRLFEHMRPCPPVDAGRTCDG